jgi:hypothetical protein
MTTDEERFSDLEQEIQLGLAALREYVSQGKQQPLSIQSAVQKALKNLDRNVPPLLLRLLIRRLRMQRSL